MKLPMRHLEAGLFLHVGLPGQELNTLSLRVSVPYSIHNVHVIKVVYLQGAVH